MAKISPNTNKRQKIGASNFRCMKKATTKKNFTSIIKTSMMMMAVSPQP